MWTRKGNDLSWEPPSEGDSEDKRRMVYARRLLAEVEEYKDQIANEEIGVMILRLGNVDRDGALAFWHTLQSIRSLPERSHA